VNTELTNLQREYQSEVRTFAESQILPFADRFDREERISAETISKLAQSGYLGAFAPVDFGGQGRDMVSAAVLHEEIGRVCSSVRSLLTVHQMVCYAVQKWGTREQKHTHLPDLASGKVLGAFALSEPGVGSDAGGIQAKASVSASGYALQGVKKWISFAQIADLFLIFARLDGAPAAFLLERATAGLTVLPIEGLLGLRASMLGELHMDNCMVPRCSLIGRVGFGLSHVGASALELGRHTVAAGCVGIAQACLEASMQYADARTQFHKPVRDHQLVSRMITNMLVNTRAARLLCYQAAAQRDGRDPEAIMTVAMAKYFASTVARKAARDAVQIHGANGCTRAYPVERYYRDAKVMEIIEGTSEIQQELIAKLGYQEYTSDGRGTEVVGSSLSTSS
jgi:glutaryl-CoA dehydrogenase (non-decarboxylating)